ncbi:MAG: hypothetical protein ACTHQ3_16490, partial [Motilibacteraceae bacterium]
MIVLVAACTLAGVLLLGPPRPDRRLHRLLARAPAGAQRSGAGTSAGGRTAAGRGSAAPDWAPGRGVRWSAAVAGGGGVALLLGGALGALTGVVVAVVALRALPRLAVGGEDPGALVEDLPLVAELLAAAVSAGVEVGAAAAAVAAVVDRPWAGTLSRAVALHRLGADAAQAWGRMGCTGPPGSWPVQGGRSHNPGVADPRPPVVAAFARSMARAVGGGAPLPESQTRQAGDVRQAQRAAAHEAPHPAGVRIVGP